MWTMLSIIRVAMSGSFLRIFSVIWTLLARTGRSGNCEDSAPAIVILGGPNQPSRDMSADFTGTF